MSLRIQTNVEAFNAHRNLVNTSTAIAKSMEKLSSGYRINRAADDAAGLAISEKMKAQIGGLGQAQRNSQDAVSLVQTAEGAMSEVHSMLQRVRDLAVQYNNGTLSTADKAAITVEVQALGSEIQRIASQTKFNDIALLSGGSSITFQVGSEGTDTLSVSLITLAGTGAGASVDTGIFTFGTGTVTLASIDDAITNVATARATFGSVQNRLEHTLNNLATYEENLTASESRIKDVDMASEMVNFTKLQILQQAGTSMLAQANSAPQSVLSLLR
ncbi:MAG TPA: flagellin [Gaiellaceae bacterium]|jgi:flagellin|nr:flagellin [Gaiellaceae bacterium]